METENFAAASSSATADDFGSVATPVYDDDYRKIPLNLIHPDPDQPRKAFDEAKLEELAATIRSRGVVHPIIVRDHPGRPGEFIITDGERRWRSSHLAGLETIPAIVRQQTAKSDILADQITSNEQQEVMTAMETAEALQLLIDEELLKGNQDARQTVQVRMGYSPSQMSKKMAFLKYPESVRELLKTGKIRDYQTVRNLSMLKPELLEVMLTHVVEEDENKTRVFNGKLFNQNPDKYAKQVRSEVQALAGEGAAKNSPVSRGTKESASRPAVVARWHMTSEEIQRLIQLTGFEVPADSGLDIVNPQQIGEIFQMFRAWFAAPGEPA